MPLIGIEKALRKADESLFAKYQVLRDELLKNEYAFTLANFPGGNDHGPGHITRVLEYLDKLLGPSPLSNGGINYYELYLSMMSILYHDVGMLKGRKNHPQEAGAVLSEKTENFFKINGDHYIFNPHDRDVIICAVVSHGSSQDIEKQCQAFAKEIAIANHTVRPRVVAALVRLADELDEDFRRAPSRVAWQMPVPLTSQFYWEFCERISGIEPSRQARSIRIDVIFEQSHVERVVALERPRLFIAAFAEKLEKMNRERGKMNAFLPEGLQYGEIHVAVRPLPGHPSWNSTRPFTFADGTTSGHFLSYYPELSVEWANQKMPQVLDLIRSNSLKPAEQELAALEKIADDLPTQIRLTVYYDGACVQSLMAGQAAQAGADSKPLLDRGESLLISWIGLGQSGAWNASAKSPYNEVFRMARDTDLRFLLSQRRQAIMAAIREEHRPAVPGVLGSEGLSYGGGGCVPSDTLIMTPDGQMPIKDIREGSRILSVDFEGTPRVISTRVHRIHTRRASRCVRINENLTLTSTQPLFEMTLGWTAAGDIKTGMRIQNWEMDGVDVVSVRDTTGYVETYTLTTDHPSHNYVAAGIVCKNKMIDFDEPHRW